MTCPICGGEFEKHHHRQKYCSQSCYEINHKEYMRSRNREKYNFQPRKSTEDVRNDFIEAIKKKYASINIDDEIDMWFGISKEE